MNINRGSREERMRWAWDSGNKNAQISISVCSAVSCPESVPFRAFSFPQPSTIKCNSKARVAPWQSRRPANNQRRRWAHLERGSFWERFRSAERMLASLSAAQLQVLFRGASLKPYTTFLPFQQPWFWGFSHRINCKSEIRLFGFSS